MNNSSSLLSQIAAEKAEKEKKRKKLRQQISNLEDEISEYDTQISNLEFKLGQQRLMKALFDGKCTNLDDEKVAKTVCARTIGPYTENLKFAKGYTEVMDDLLHGSTAQTYEGYRQETSQYMQTEIDDNQRKLEEVQTVRNNKQATVTSLRAELAKI